MAHPNTGPLYTAYLDTDLGRFHLSVNINLTGPAHPDEDEVQFRAAQLLDLFRAALTDEAQRINFLTTMLGRSSASLQAKYDVAVKGLKDIRDDNLAPRSGARQTLKTIGEQE